MTRLGLSAIGTAAYGVFSPKAPASGSAVAQITRLGQFGAGLAAYVVFLPKGAAGASTHTGLFTRLGQFGPGLSAYGVFLPKTAASTEAVGNHGGHAGQWWLRDNWTPRYSKTFEAKPLQPRRKIPQNAKVMARLVLQRVPVARVLGQLKWRLQVEEEDELMLLGLL